MRVNEFLRLVAVTTRAQLPARQRRFQTQMRFTFIQLFYDKRALHYEVWVRGKERLLEIGLHFESNRETNAKLLDYFREWGRSFEIKAELGDQVEAEQWTTSWTRVHQLVPYQQLDEDTARATGERLAKMIEVLQPMLERAASEIIPRPVRKARART